MDRILIANRIRCSLKKLCRNRSYSSFRCQMVQILANCRGNKTDYAGRHVHVNDSRVSVVFETLLRVRRHRLIYYMYFRSELTRQPLM
jgi:hypothetical protein